MKCWWVVITSFIIFGGRPFQNSVNTIFYFWSLSMCKFTSALCVCHADFLCSTLFGRWICISDVEMGITFSFQGNRPNQAAILFVNILERLCFVLCGRNTQTPIPNFVQI